MTYLASPGNATEAEGKGTKGTKGLDGDLPGVPFVL